jgi:ribose-phosphate pyrophosphokinase
MLYLNGQLVNVTMFPDNTSQVWKLPHHISNSDYAWVDWSFSNESEILHLAQLKTLLDHYGAPTSLRIRYLPYGRQDKVVSNHTTFALITFSQILNNMSFDNIEIIDPHSTIATDLIKNSVAIQSTKISELWNTGEYDVVCYPDKGALSKYTKLYDYPYMHGEKVRDQITGNITSYQIVGDPAGKNVLIVDDICDGGMTFRLLAKDLLAAGAKSVVLFVTHGIFSKGTRILFESGIQRIFTQDGEVSNRHGTFYL